MIYFVYSKPKNFLHSLKILIEYLRQIVLLFESLQKFESLTLSSVYSNYLVILVVTVENNLTKIRHNSSISSTNHTKVVIEIRQILVPISGNSFIVQTNQKVLHFYMLNKWVQNTLKL